MLLLKLDKVPAKDPKLCIWLTCVKPKTPGRNHCADHQGIADHWKALAQQPHE